MKPATFELADVQIWHSFSPGLLSSPMHCAPFLSLHSANHHSTTSHPGSIVLDSNTVLRCSFASRRDIVDWSRSFCAEFRTVTVYPCARLPHTNRSRVSWVSFSRVSLTSSTVSRWEPAFPVCLEGGTLSLARSVSIVRHDFYSLIISNIETFWPTRSMKYRYQ